MSQPLRSVSHTGPDVRLGPRRRLHPDMLDFVYGLDIETDTTVDGLDPAVAAIVAVGVSTGREDRVFDGPEAQLLLDLDAWLATLPAGVLVTWNGSTFDLPFLMDRADRNEVQLGLQLCADRSIPVRRDPIGDHQHAYRGRWHHHAHLDAYRLYRGDVGPAFSISCALKSIARFVGLPTVEVDVEHLHELPPADVASYVLSDARLARQLVLRRWASARRFADPRPFDGDLPIEPSPGALLDAPRPQGVRAVHPPVEGESVRIVHLPGSARASAGEVAVG